MQKNPKRSNFVPWFMIYWESVPSYSKQIGIFRNEGLFLETRIRHKEGGNKLALIGTNSIDLLRLKSNLKEIVLVLFERNWNNKNNNACGASQLFLLFQFLSIYSLTFHSTVQVEIICNFQSYRSNNSTCTIEI